MLSETIPDIIKIIINKASIITINNIINGIKGAITESVNLNEVDLPNNIFFVNFLFSFVGLSLLSDFSF